MWAKGVISVGINGGINFFTTTDNLWVVTDINIAGGDTHTLLGAHREHSFHDTTTVWKKHSVHKVTPESRQKSLFALS